MKKFLSVILVAVLFLVQIPATILADTPNAISHTVLVLDTSDSENFYSGGHNLIYTANTAISYVKASAKVFVQEILSASRNNYIAIVSFKNIATIETDFTNDYNTLVSKINGLYSSSNDRNIAAGLSTAQSILNSVSSYQTQKNVVLFTTGMTDCGDYDYNGKYSSSVVGSGWYNMSTNIKLYAYANTALSVASKLKNTADIYTLGLFQTMENMPSEGKEVVSLFKKTAKDLASSADHFYEVDDPSKLEFAFTEIAGDIIIPLSLQLNNTLVSHLVSSENEEEKITHYYSRYLYTVTATIENLANDTARNVICSIEPPEKAYTFNEMISSAEQYTKSLGDLAPGATTTVTWNLEFDWPEDDTSAIYKVSAKSDNSLEMVQTDIIYLKPKTVTDNTFIMGVDQWSFRNFYDYFGPDGETYYITPSDRETLMFNKNLTQTEKDAMRDYLNSTWAGSCYGMSTTAVLTKMGIYNASDIQPPKTTVYDVTKTNNDALESWINFYHVTQELTSISNEITNYGQMNVIDQLQDIERKAQAVKDGGSPFVLIFYLNGGGGHAVVGYGHETKETGSWKFGGFLGFGAREYTNRILIYDCTAPDEVDDVCLYYDIASGTYEIPNWDVSYLSGAIDNIALLDTLNYTTEATNQYNYVTTTNLTEYSIKLGDSTYKIIPNTKIEEERMLTRFQLNGPGEESPMILAIPAENNDYTVDVDKKTDFTVRSSHQNYATKVTAESADEINFSGDGKVKMNGIDGKYELNVVANEGNYNTPWYKTSVAGAEATDMALTSTSEGIKIEGNNLSDITITTSDDFTKKHTAINTSETSVLVTADANSQPAVLYDADKDGKYESRIETYTVTVQSSVGGQTRFTEIECSEGATVNLEAITDAGYGFSQWSSNDVKLSWTKYFSKSKFVMPNHDVTVYAYFSPVETALDKIWYTVKNFISSLIK